ncbi:hypothetical protein [Pontibacter indicus]|uniref:Uncharacterized protein n=1 Tax=Pontibacter indicus TaxID=1317125 RepID=A0A1R3XSS5_9BACT|nr:hypothetical protein [Pontibacter indicus]SIT94928.1 hypothetical protein SAMN05444128_3815 [Pontibacter indicus]
MKLILLSLFSVFFISFSSFQGVFPERVSLIKLLANPDKYHGKRVLVAGFLHLEHEDNSLYFSKEHANYLSTENAVWVKLGKNMRVEDAEGSPTTTDALNRKYVMIIGKFNKDGAGHMGIFSGEIEGIERIFELKKFYHD